MVVNTWQSSTFSHGKGSGYGSYQLKVAKPNKVTYHHNENVSNFHFGQTHPMKPFRLALTNQMVIGYGLHELMDVYRTRPATYEELRSYHTADFVDFLKRVTPDIAAASKNELYAFRLYDDCPIFDGLYDYCSLYTGASLDAARKIVNRQADIAINWSGGLHHAKKSEASGFCYVNDIVLAVLTLLRQYPRVLYIDIDLHHGDGVQEAFYATDRVMTISFHKYDGEFFPQTGNSHEVGTGYGEHHSLNVPLNDGINDEAYLRLFKSVVEPVFNSYRPAAVVLQCGADSLGGDKLEHFNLTIQGHGECVEFVKTFGIPMLVLGGGGYRPRNVSRLWAYETGVCLGADLADELPSSLQYREWYRPDYKLHSPLDAKYRTNQCSPGHLEKVRIRVLEQLRYICHAPSVQMQEIPPEFDGFQQEEEDRLNEEIRDRIAHGEEGESREDKKELSV